MQAQCCGWGRQVCWRVAVRDCRRNLQYARGLFTHRNLDRYIRRKQLIGEVRDGLDVERDPCLALRSGVRGGDAEDGRHGEQMAATSP